MIFWPTFRKKNGELKDGECMEILIFFFAGKMDLF